MLQVVKCGRENNTGNVWLRVRDSTFTKIKTKKVCLLDHYLFCITHYQIYLLFVIFFYHVSYYWSGRAAHRHLSCDAQQFYTPRNRTNEEIAAQHQQYFYYFYFWQLLGPVSFQKDDCASIGNCQWPCSGRTRAGPLYSVSKDKDKR